MNNAGLNEGEATGRLASRAPARFFGDRIPYGWLGATLFVLVTGIMAERLTDKFKAPEAPCLLPGTINEVSINGQVWRGPACRDTAAVCITGAKPIRRKK